MSHVDDGALHAYLDGALDEYPSAEAEGIRAHLDACTECADRLEAERSIRSDAHAMLGLAAPAVEAPSFEELRAYVQRTRPRRSRISRMQRVGWAASVVLALGAGWMIREGQLQTRALDVRQERALAPTGSRTPSADGAAVGGAVATEGAASVEDGRQAAPVTAARAGSAAAGEATPSRVPPAPEPASATAFEEPEMEEMTVRAARPAAEAEVGARIDVSDDPTMERPSSTEVVVAADSMQAAETTRVADDDVPEQRMASFDAVSRVDDTAAVGSRAEEVTIEPTTFEDRRREAVVIAPATSARSAGGAMDSPSTSALRTGAEDRSLAPATLSQGAAVERDSMAVEPLLALPGYEVISVTNLGDRTTPWGVRVLQALEDERRLEVIHLEPEIDPSILPDLDEGWSQVRTRTERGWILLRGPLPEADLSTLLQRIFPESR